VTRLKLSTTLGKVQITSWFDLLALLMYGYVSITLSITDNKTPAYVLVLNVVIFLALIFWDDWLKKKKSIETVEMNINRIKNTSFPLLFIIYIILGRTVEFLEIINLFAPGFFCCHFWVLVKNSEKTNDRWLRVQSMFHRYAKEEKIVVIKPISNDIEPSEDSLGLTKFVAFPTTGGLSYQKFEYFRGSIREVDFEHTPFLFRNNKLMDQSKFSYEIPSQQSFQFLDTSKNLNLEYGMTQLQMNTLTYIFISSILTELDERKIIDATDLSKYTSNRNKFKYEYRLSENTLIGSSHRWSNVELGLVSTKILDAFFSANKTRHSKRIEQLMEENLMIVAKDSPLYVPIIHSFLVLLSNLTENDNDEHGEELWVGALHAFSNSVRIICENILSDVEAITDYKYEIPNKHELRNDLVDRQKDIQRYGENVTEFFITLHDTLIDSLKNANGPRKNENLCFDRFIQNMVTMLGNTNYKQHQVRDNKYTLFQLTNLRTGIVLGTTVAIKILIDYMEG
jgi:hypothetical protein